MEWYKSQSLEEPLEIDMTSSGVYNYVRRNIVESEQTDEEGNTYTVYDYEEMRVPKENWEAYKIAAKNATDIEYIAMMADVELED